MLRQVMQALEKEQVRYCILHGWHSLPEYLPSDVDIIIAPQDLAKLEKVLLETAGAQLVQMRQHESSCYYFVLASVNENRLSFLQLDTALDYRRNGFIAFTAEEILASRQAWNGFWVAAPQAEFAYLLTKNVAKGVLPDRHKARLRHLHRTLGTEAKHVACHLFGIRWGGDVVERISASAWQEFEAKIPALKRALHWQILKRDPLNPARFWLPELRRVWRRLWYPTGLFIGVLGSDGAGKSTLIGRLKDDLKGVFDHADVFHFRPRLVGKKAPHGPVTDPHGKPPYSWWLSALKLLFYLVEYVLGYVALLVPRLVRSTLVIFDRYYDDLLADPRRYRYGGPEWLLLLIRAVIPRPDLFLILDAPEDRVLARKQEVSLQELKRQRQAYRKLAAQLPNAILLDGTLPIEQLAHHAGETVLDYLQERYLNRRTALYRDTERETLSWLASVLSPGPQYARFAEGGQTPPSLEKDGQVQGRFGLLTVKGQREYLLPLRPRCRAVRALHLYNAQNWKARNAKAALATGLRLGLGRFLLPTVSFTVAHNRQTPDLGKACLFEHLKEVLGRQDIDFAISCGTPGLDRKPVVQVLTEDARTLAFVKIGWNQATRALVQNEAAVLRQLGQARRRSFTMPRLLYAGDWNGRSLCIQSAPEGELAAAPRQLSAGYRDVLVELTSLHTQRVALSHCAFWNDLEARSAAVSHSYYRRIFDRGRRAVKKWYGDTPVLLHFRHGDFAPWNTYVLNGKMFVFDWEYAVADAPGGYDFFHFTIQTARLLYKRSPLQAYRQIFSTEEAEEGGPWMREYRETVGITQSHLPPLFLLYVLDRLVHYTAERATDREALRYFAALLQLALFETESCR